MKSNQKQELRELTAQQLRDKVIELEKKLAQARMEHAVGKLKNPSSLLHLRKDLAIVKTIFREKELFNEAQEVDSQFKNQPEDQLQNQSEDK